MRYRNCVESMLMLFEGQVDITRQEDKVGRWMVTRIRMKVVNIQKQRWQVPYLQTMLISPLEHDQNQCYLLSRALLQGDVKNICGLTV